MCIWVFLQDATSELSFKKWLKPLPEEEDEVVQQVQELPAGRQKDLHQGKDSGRVSPHY